MLEGSGVKPLFLCVKVFVTVSFDISIRQADRSLVSGFVLGPYSSVFVCLGFFISFLWMDLIKNNDNNKILLTALFERAHSSQNALVWRLKWDSKSRSVPVSTCMQAFTVRPYRFCSTWLWPPSLPSSRGGSFLLKILFMFTFVSFKCTPVPPPAFLQLQLNPRQTNCKRFKWYIWVIGLNQTRSVMETWRVVFECVFVFMITYWFFFFLSCFLVKTTWTCHDDLFV